MKSCFAVTRSKQARGQRWLEPHLQCWSSGGTVPGCPEGGEWLPPALAETDQTSYHGGGDLPHLQVLRVEPQSRQRQKQLLVTKKCSHLWLYYLRLILTWLRRRYLRYGGEWERPPTQEPDTPGETDTSQITAPAKWRIGRFQPSPHPPQEVALPWF